MKRFFSNLICAFIPSKKQRDFFRRKHNDYEKILRKNHIEINNEDKKFIKLFISGENNTVVIKKLSKSATGMIGIHLFGDNCKIILDENIYVSDNIEIFMGNDYPNFGRIEKAEISIGKEASFEKATIVTFNSNAKINIGERCMFSFGVYIYQTDAHPIYNIETNQIINKVRTMNIGNHVWIGMNACILKNTVIADDCIVGWGSVVSGKFMQTHSVIAGNPAKIVRTGMTWDSNSSLGYVQNDLSE